ncbi:MAG: NADH-quinone oxidoreductase subunit C [bacterium]
MSEEAQAGAEPEAPAEASDPDAAALRAALGEGVRAVRRHRGQLAVEIAPPALLEAARLLRDSLGYAQLSFVAGVDCLDLSVPHRFKAVYGLLNLERGARIRLEAPCEDDLDPRLPSVSGVWEAAARHECEAFDMVGIVFEGHPGLERILTPEGFEGHPHRKDFDIGREPVEFTFRETPAGKPEAKE